MAMSAAYAVCTAVICLEVTVILGLVLFLLRPQKDTAQLQPDAGNVKTEFTPAEEEAPAREVEYRIEYNDSEQDDELNEQEDIISRGIPSEPESDTPAFTTIAATIALPTKPQRKSSTSSSSSASSMPPAKVDSPKLMRSDSSSSASSNADLIPKLIPEMPGIDESDIISGADDVEINNGWRRKVKLSSLQRSGIIKRDQINDFLIGDISKDKLENQYSRWLKGEEPIAGILFPDTGLKKSIFTAQKEEYISRSTAISLLEAQAATGNIIDPISARKMSVTEAAQDGQFDKIYEQCLLRAERAVTGYKQGGYNTRLSDEKLSIFEAMTKGLVVEEHAIRLLEAQIATGGVIDVRNNHRVPIQYALKMGLIDERIYRIIADKPTTTNFEDPNSTRTPPEKVSYSQLLANSIIDDDTGLRLFLFQKPGFEKTQSHTSSPQSMRSAKSSSSSIASIGSVSSKNKDLGQQEEDEIKPFPVDEDIPTVEKIDSVSTEQEVTALDEGAVPVEDTKSITSRSSAKSLSIKESDILQDASTTEVEDLEQEQSEHSVSEPEPKPERVSEKIDKFKQKIEEVQKREREEEERERREKEKQEKESETKKAKVKKMRPVDTETDTAASDLLLSSDDTDVDGNRLELSSMTTSDAQTDQEVQIQELEELQKMETLLKKPTQIDESSSDEAELQTVREQVRRKSKREKKKKKDKGESAPGTPKSKSKKMTATTIDVVISDDEPPTEPVGPAKQRDDLTFTTGWRKQCAIVDLVDAGLMAESKVKKIESGHLLMADAENELQQWLHGSSPIAGLLIISTGEKMSLYSAAKRGFLRRGTAISLLEAQAATGNVIDPITGEYMAVEEATRKGLIDRQYEAILSRAEKAVHGYKSKFSETLLSVYQALQKGMLIENHAIRLLEAQIVTGGIIDPHRHHRCPIDLAIKRGLFDEKLKVVLEGIGDDTKGFFDPNTEQNLNYSELVEQCVTDAETGLLLLPYKKKPPEEKLSGPLAKVLFESELRRKVTLQDVVDADLIEPETLRRFKSGEMSAHEVKQLVDSLKIHVEGSMPIAGVINAENGQRLSIFQATQAGLIRKGTAYELLEAQASCGKIVDVQTGRVLSVETASKTGVFDAEYEDVVMRASRAVTGYREPFKKEILSLCEAISRHLVVERNGVRLLEAQVATGGIIDMKSPLRLSIEAALRKGLLESRLAKQLQARTSKSYFDPNTGENLNYAQLMERCITDPDTGMLFLEVEAGAVTPKVGPFEPEDRKKKKIRAQSADPSSPKKKKKKKEQDESRSQSEPRPSKDKKKDKKSKKKKREGKDKDDETKSTKSSRSKSPKSPKKSKSDSLQSPKSTTSIDIAPSTPKKSKEIPTKEEMLGIEPKKDKKKKKKKERKEEKEVHYRRASSSETEKVEMKSETETKPKKSKKSKKPSKKPSKPPKIVSRKVVIVDLDGNELSLEDALKYNYIDQALANELQAQEYGDDNDEEPKLEE
ncbi:Oidioi.mRNA.OKI2018_I69.XSR.g15017.t2.cds [Oikopleura dioica]|uniref:Oidioi.mRNA.OKI2018_I69.XSR.g15017.t2.cds n=1 Tax=Oikopleura dioica TaxID=34765 RepID=A0ABN7SFK3_OIKDI|nr:Oidioi.mRNA.OKI2018_I69.XSR.g15017.t2.cds [Oikopleura dioica]